MLAPLIKPAPCLAPTASQVWRGQGDGGPHHLHAHPAAAEARGPGQPPQVLRGGGRPAAHTPPTPLSAACLCSRGSCRTACEGRECCGHWCTAHAMHAGRAGWVVGSWGDHRHGQAVSGSNAASCLSLSMELGQPPPLPAPARSWQHITDQIGMFCFTGITPEQVSKAAPLQTSLSCPRVRRVPL